MAFSFFKKKKDKAKDSRYITLKIEEVIPVAKDAVNVVFEPSDGFSYQSGQFLTIIDSVNGEKLRRAYSLCSSPYLNESPAVTVKRVEDGKMSNHINDHFKAGQEIEVMEPMGSFTTNFDASNERHLIFLGGGSGITPLFSMIKSLLTAEPKSKATLFYGNRSEEYIIFKNELGQLVEVNKDRFSLIHVLEEDEKGFADIKGRPSLGILTDLISSGKLKGDEYFICGPQPMMDVVEEALLANDIPGEKIRIESFEAGVTSPKELFTESNTSAASVTIILDGEEYLVPVPKGASILATALDAGLDMPYSCQSGICTACRGKCLEGDVTIDDVEGLSKKEIDEGYRLLCIGKPAADHIKIEVG